MSEGKAHTKHFSSLMSCQYMRTSVSVAAKVAKAPAGLWLRVVAHDFAPFIVNVCAVRLPERRSGV